MRVRAACAVGDELLDAARRTATRPDRARSSSSARSTCASCGSTPAIGSRNSAEPLEQPHDVGADARRRDGNRRSRPACGGRCDRAARCAARPPTASTAGRRARADGRTRSCAPRRRASVETSRLGPSSARNRATSVSRRAADSSSWKTPLASCARALSASRSISSVSRWATNTSVFSFAPPPARAPASAARRAADRLRSIASACCRSSVSSGPSTAFSAAPDASARRMRSTVAPRAPRDRSRHRSRRSRASTRARASARTPPSAGDRSAIGDARRQPADVDATRRAGARRQRHAGRRAAPRRRRPPGNSSGRSSCSSRKNPCASSSSGVALSSSTWRPSAAIGAIGAIARLAGMPGRTPQPLRLVDDEQVDAGADRLRGQLGPLDQRLERDDRAAMDVERD